MRGLLERQMFLRLRAFRPNQRPNAADSTAFDARSNSVTALSLDATCVTMKPAFLALYCKAKKRFFRTLIPTRSTMKTHLILSHLVAIVLALPAHGDEPVSPPAKVEPTKATFLITGLH